jgi:hypothetical protein
MRREAPLDTRKAGNDGEADAQRAGTVNSASGMMRQTLPARPPKRNTQRTAWVPGRHVHVFWSFSGRPGYISAGARRARADLAEAIANSTAPRHHPPRYGIKLHP